MYGALYGDVIGSYFEMCCTKDYNFQFAKESTFTDDSLMTVAVCSAILNNHESISFFSLNKRALEYAGQFKQYFSYYPYAGYGNMFSQWARDTEYKKIHSYGNGAAMRVIPIGYAYDSMEQVLLQAKASCLYTHKSSEVINGAQAVAASVFLARSGKEKSEIKEYLRKKFGYDLSKSIPEIRSNYIFDSRSSYSVPPAIIAFLDSTDYESAIRNAVSLGGDADTQACIAGGIAEAFYKDIPEHISNFCNKRIDYELRKVAEVFKNRFCV